MLERRGGSRGRAASGACSSFVSSSGHLPPSAVARPHSGHTHASWPAALWSTSSTSTRPSDAASRVCFQPAAARPPRPCSSCQRSSSSCSARARASSSSGRTTSSSSVGRGVRLGGRPADHGLAGFGRQGALDLAAQLLRRHDHHLQTAGPARLLVDLVADRLQVLLDEVLDVALVARLRPAALAVPAGRLLGLVDDLDEPATGEAVDGAPLAREDDDEAAVAAELPGERCHDELAADPHEIPHRLGERQRPELAVGGRGEDRDALCPVPVELVVPPGADARQVVLQGEPAVPRAAVRLRLFLELGEEGVEPASRPATRSPSTMDPGRCRG